MPDHLQSFQLDFLTPDMFRKIVKKAITQGVQIRGHHGNYINFHMGDMLLIIRTAFDAEKQLDYITGFDSHCKGCCVWECTLKAVAEKADVTEKTVLIEKDGRELFLPLINGDILPSYEPGTAFKAQVAAYPEELRFCREGETARPFVADGEKITLSGKAIGFRRGETTYMGGTLTRFIIALVETELGQLEVVFPDKMVREDDDDLLCPGTVLEFTGELAANPAILELERGVRTPEVLQ